MGARSRRELMDTHTETPHMAAGAGRRPLVSVVMSVYNGARFLDEAVNSIRAQTFRNWEFLIVDDGSTDASPDILARHARSDARIRILSQKNAGLIRSLNRGFAEASAAFIARMDADDVSRPYRFEMQLDFLNDNPGVALVGGAIEVIDAQGRPMNVIRLPLTPDRLRAHMLELGCGLAHPTVLFDRTVLQKTGTFRSAYRHAEDYDLWLRMLEHVQLANLDEILLSYRRHGESVSYKHATQQILSALCARTVAGRRLQGLDDPTCGVELITPAVLTGLGVPRQVIDDEIFKTLFWMTEEAIRYGMPAAAAQFSNIARPHASPERLEQASVELGLKAARAGGNIIGRLKYLLKLLAADRRVFFAVTRSLLAAGSAA